MAARDSDDDIRKYLPDLSTILREADPARAKEKLAKAQDNPELDAALAHAQRPSVRPSEASPWAAEPVGIAKAALPSSLAAPPVVKEAKARPVKRAGFPGWAKGIVAVIAAVGPATLLWVLLVRPSGRERVDPPRAAVSAGSSATPTPTMSATAPASAPTPSPIPAAPAPTVKTDVDAGASAPLTVPLSIAPTKPKAHATTSADPYDAAPPGPAKTVEPAAPPPPAPTSSSWF